MIDHDNDTRVPARMTPVLGAAVMAAGGAVLAYLSPPARRRRAAKDKHRALVAYLHDHLSGSDVALRVVRKLASTHEGTPDGVLCRLLMEEFERDRVALRSLLHHLHASTLSPKRAAGRASGVLASHVAGGAPGDVALLRALEALAIAIQGKRCLWRGLQSLATTPAAGPLDFVELEARAVRQWQTVDDRRRELAIATFPDLATP